MDYQFQNSDINYRTFTPKENFKAALARKPIQWIPSKNDYVFFSPRILPENVARVMVHEAQSIRDEERNGGIDMFGIAWTYVPESMGAIVRPGRPFLNHISEWKQAIDTFYENISDAAILFFDDFPNEEIADYFHNHR